MARSNIISRSHQDVAHLCLPTNNNTKYQLSTPYNSKIYPGQYLTVQCHNAKVTTWPCTAISLPVVNNLHLTVSVIQPGQDFKVQSH